MLLFASNLKTTSAIAVICSYKMHSFNIVGSVYTCDARVNFDGNENVTTVSGNHQSGKGDNNVMGIRLVSLNLPFVPTNINNFFPNLIVLDLFTNIITSISKRHLMPFPSLQYLSLEKNRIDSLDGNLFSGMNSLRRIDFDNNYIRHVGHDLYLPTGGSIYFYNNPCISQAATTPDQVASLKLNLLRNCPPTISQIEMTLESRPNLLTNVVGQVKSLINTTDEITYEVTSLSTEHRTLSSVVQSLGSQTDEMDDVVKSLLNVVADLSSQNRELETRLAFLEAFIENKLGLEVKTKP